jgi:hypothetical protein
MTISSSSGTAIVLVHGGFVDGSGWEGVYQALRRTAMTSAWFRIPPSRLPAMWWRRTP